MVNQSDTVTFDEFGFDGQEYVDMQKDAIEDRLACFDDKVYLEIGGKFLLDPHASRVLPGFFPDTKVRIFRELLDQAVIVFCINVQDIDGNRQLTNEDIDYEDYVMDMLTDIEDKLGEKAVIAMTMMRHGEVSKKVAAFSKRLEDAGYRIFFKYFIEGYPDDLAHVLSDEGYGKDQRIETDKQLVLVTGAASNSGKMGTCLSQIYLDREAGLDSGYAKYETFPIWNLELGHPVNLAYEAATADIGDFNCVDSFHKEVYAEDAINYNRDVAGFPIISGLIQEIVGSDNYMRMYHSPTDMGINQAGFCITDEEVIKQACLEEIQRRRDWYAQMVARGEGEQSWVEKCEELEEQCREWSL